MQFFPHRIPSTRVSSATSASLALSASFVNNINTPSITITNSASLALNISGSAGSPGADFTKSGPRGPQGATGRRGARGQNVYLLSVGWSQSPASACYEIQAGSATLSGGGFNCDFGVVTTYYTDASPSTSDVGSFIYFDRECTTPYQTAVFGNLARTGIVINDQPVITTNSSGQITQTDICSTSS